MIARNASTPLTGFRGAGRSMLLIIAAIFWPAFGTGNRRVCRISIDTGLSARNRMNMIERASGGACFNAYVKLAPARACLVRADAYDRTVMETMCLVSPHRVSPNKLITVETTRCDRLASAALHHLAVDRDVGTPWDRDEEAMSRLFIRRNLWPDWLRASLMARLQ
jgi:hypothetical protein